MVPCGEPEAGEVSEPGSLIVYGGHDAVVSRTLYRVAAEHGLTVADAPDDLSSGRAVLVVVVDVDSDDHLLEVAPWQSRCPRAAVVGVVRQPDPARWRAAERAGCDFVTTRGALGPQLRRWLVPGAVRRRRVAILDASDIAGRLGFIQRVEQTPVGPLAVFRVQGALCAIADRCPHAGAALSSGPLEGEILTCPGHGSQFDVTTGERVRGPADAGVAVHRLVEEAGRVFLEWSAPVS